MTAQSYEARGGTLLGEGRCAPSQDAKLFAYAGKDRSEFFPVRVIRVYLRLKDRGEGVGGEGFAEEVALDLVAAEQLQEPQLIFCLDAFGNHFQTQVVGERDDGHHELSVVRVARCFHHKRSINLERIDRQSLQRGQRREAGAEVVDRDVDAHTLQPAQHLRRKLRVLHDGALRQLQLQILRRQSCLFENPDHSLRQILIVKLSRGNVHRDLHWRKPLITPAPSLQTRRAQNPFADRHDQARVFRERNEL